MLAVRNASGVIQTMFVYCLIMGYVWQKVIMNNTSLELNKMHEYKNTILGNADTICLHWIIKYLKKHLEAHRLCENIMS